ncbi:MAG: transposase [Phycisphaeraceae bacterium]|nr:transposase [Phycisphaeraceae bacterium]
MPKPSPGPAPDDAAAEAAEKRRGVSGAAVESAPRRRRRKFPASEKLRIIRAADAALASGKRGALEALLRKEGIYGSHLSTWRQQLGAHGIEGLASHRPGRKPKLDDKDRALLAAEKRNAVLERKLRIAEAVIELQKKAHAVLGIALPNLDEVDS